MQAGIEKKFHELGKTTIYGEYYDYEGGGNNRRNVAAATALNPTGAGNWAIWGTGVEVYGAGIAQGIDKAAMIVYLRHVEATSRAKAGGTRTILIEVWTRHVAGGIAVLMRATTLR